MLPQLYDLNVLDLGELLMFPEGLGVKVTMLLLIIIMVVIYLLTLPRRKERAAAS